MTISSIVQWFIIAKPEPNIKDISMQIGCHYEEVAEMAVCLGDKNLAVKLNTVSHAYKQGACYYSGDKVALLDALCDQIVTAIGIGVMMGFDMEKALAEVNRSNYTKFKPYDGDYLPYIRPDGKIGKNPDTYKEPELAQFFRRIL